MLLFGSDPVAVDAVAHDIVVKERMARGTQQVDAKDRSAFLDLAEGLGLGRGGAGEDRDRGLGSGILVCRRRSVGRPRYIRMLQDTMALREDADYRGERGIFLIIRDHEERKSIVFWSVW